MDTCQITTRVTLPSTPLTTTSDLRIQQIGERFLVTLAPLAPPTSVQGAWGRATKSGLLDGNTVSFQDTFDVGIGLTAVGKASAGDQLIELHAGASDGHGKVAVDAAVVDEQTKVLGPPNTVLTANEFVQVLMTRVTSSLDGHQAIFAHGNRELEHPTAMVLGGDAQRRGEPVTLSTGPDYGWHCLDVIPTAAAGAVSFVEWPNDRATFFWHVVELGADGTKRFESRVDITAHVQASTIQRTCPHLTLMPNGFAALFVDGVAPAVIAAVDRTTFAASGATSILPRTESGPVVRARALAAMADGIALQFSGEGESSSHVRNFDLKGHPLSSDLVLPAELTLGRAIPSNPGTLLLTAREGTGPVGWLGVTCGGGQ